MARQLRHARETRQAFFKSGRMIADEKVDRMSQLVLRKHTKYHRMPVWSCQQRQAETLKAAKIRYVHNCAYVYTYSTNRHHVEPVKSIGISHVLYHLISISVIDMIEQPICIAKPGELMLLLMLI